MSAKLKHLSPHLTVSTDQLKLNLDFTYDYLKNSYWAKGRSFATMKKSFEHSICFGLYLNGHQIGFARTVSDFTVFAYLMDVFVIDQYKGLGYGTFLMDKVINSPQLKDVENLMLATNDAHRFYEKHGFRPLKNPEKLMKKI